jgi:hypothetical protein
MTKSAAVGPTRTSIANGVASSEGSGKRARAIVPNVHRRRTGSMRELAADAGSP